MTMPHSVGTDLKLLHDQIYGPDEPENIFGGGNAGIALAGHYLAQALNARQPSAEVVKQLLFHLNTLLFELSDTPPGTPLHAAIRNVTAAKNEVKI